MRYFKMVDPDFPLMPNLVAVHDTISDEQFLSVVDVANSNLEHPRTPVEITLDEFEGLRQLAPGITTLGEPEGDDAA